jgi:hypothetical protein
MPLVKKSINILSLFGQKKKKHFEAISGTRPPLKDKTHKIGDGINLNKIQFYLRQLDLETSDVNRRFLLGALSDDADMRFAFIFGIFIITKQT